MRRGLWGAVRLVYRKGAPAAARRRTQESVVELFSSWDSVELSFGNECDGFCSWCIANDWCDGLDGHADAAPKVPPFTLGDQLKRVA